MKRCFLLLILLVCMGAARAEDLTCVRDGAHRLMGEIVVDGYAFAIDAVLEEGLPAASRVSYHAKAFDPASWEAALRECFPESADDLIARYTLSGAEVWTTDDWPAVSGIPVLPASENAPDAWLAARQAQCAAFLAAVGVACDPIPFSVTYTASRPDSSFPVCMDASDRDRATGAQLCFLLSAGEAPVAIGGELLSRHNGSFGGWGKALICRCPAARFQFDLEGRLLDFHAACLDMEVSGASVEDFLSWEEALALMLSDFVAHENIRRNLADFGYTVTAIRRAWDLDARDTGRPGWMISLSAKSEAAASPTGWINRVYTGFVYGDK